MAKTVVSVQCSQNAASDADLTLCIEKSKNLYSIVDDKLTVAGEPLSDEKFLLQQIHPEKALNSFFLYHWDFVKQKTNNKTVNYQFFPVFDLLSVNSENDVLETVLLKMPQGLFPIFRIDF